jgi:hypothetical protein
MKIKIFFSLLASLIIAVSVFAGDGKTGYTGNWKIDKVKSSPSSSSLLLSEISFKVNNDSLQTMRTYESSNGETYTFNENLTLDSKEYKIVIYEMPRKAKAQWSEKGSSLLIESTTTFTRDSDDQNVTSIETWTLSESGNQLTYDFVTKTSEGSEKGILYFNKS